MSGSSSRGRWTRTNAQTTPVTHRTEHVGLGDAEQTQLGSQQYSKTLQQNQAAIVSSGAGYAQVQRVAKRIEAGGKIVVHNDS